MRSFEMYTAKWEILFGLHHLTSIKFVLSYVQMNSRRPNPFSNNDGFPKHEFDCFGDSYKLNVQNNSVPNKTIKFCQIV